MLEYNNRVILHEYTPFIISKEVINEGVNNPNKPFIVSGVIQRANAKNGNGRVYKYETLVRENNRYQQLIQENRSLGELDHPMGAESANVINLKNVSHRILETWWDGEELYGKFQILNTPSGNILKNLILEGITVGVSSRGMGSIKQIGETVQVQDDFELLCWDFVSNPSTQGAFMEMVNEGLTNPVYNKYTNINESISTILCNRVGFCECDFN